MDKQDLAEKGWGMKVKTVSLDNLLEGAERLNILHQAEMYQLVITKQNKLLLTKINLNRSHHE